MLVNKSLVLIAGQELMAQYFLQRRELGVINIGGPGRILIEGKTWEVGSRDGMCTKDIVFESEDGRNPAKFYLNSAPWTENTDPKYCFRMW